MAEGRFGIVSPGRVAQALLHSDDPYLLLTSPSPWPDPDEWPAGSALTRDIAGPIMKAHVASDEVVVAASLVTFASDTKSDAELLLVVPTQNRPDSWMRTTFNGRGHLVYRGDRWEPQQAPLALVHRSGGQHRFWFSGFDLFPTAEWEAIGLQPLARDPRVWLLDGQVGARLESYHGHRRTWMRDGWHRTPHLLRWVWKRTAVEKYEAFRNARLVELVDTRLVGLEERY